MGDSHHNRTTASAVAAGICFLALCAPLDSVWAARLDPALWTPAFLTNVADNNLATSLTNLQFAIDLGRTCTVDRIYLTGTNRTLQYWPNSQAATNPPLGLVTVAVGNTSPPTNQVGVFTVPYDAGNPVDTEVDIRFSPVAGRYVSIQLQTNVVWGSSNWPGWTITPQPPAPTNLTWRVAELEIYGFSGTFSNRDAVARATNSIASGNGFLFPLDIAAADLSYYLSELSGYPVPLITPGQTNLYPGRIYRVMDLASLATNYNSMMANIASGALPTNPVVTVVGREIQFSGWPYRCVVWGVWEFLERQGVRWVYPDAHGDAVPAGGGVSVSMLPMRCTPCARSIYANWGVPSLQPWPPWEKQTVRESFLYPWRNHWNDTSGSGYGPLGGSEIPKAAAPDTLNTNYSEQFSGYPGNFTAVLPNRILLQNTNWWGYDPAYGCRVNPTNETITFCMNNPEVVNWVAGKLVAVDAAYPIPSRYPLNLAHINDVYNVMPNDSTRYCQDCDWCLAANGPAVPVGDAWVTLSTQSFSGSYFSFIAKLATNISQQGCGALIGAMAYADVYEPPANLAALPSNVQVEVCMYGSPNLPLLSPANAKLKTAWDAWHATCSRLATYDYALLHVDYWQQDARLPVPLVTAIVDRAQYLAQLGALNGGCQATPESLPYNPWNFYTYPRIRWNTNQTPSQVLQEFAAGYFGEAAQPMLGYYNVLEKYLIANNIDLRRHGYCYTLPPGGIPLAVLYGMQTNLVAAQAISTNWLTRQRIAFLADGFNWVLAQQGLTGVNLNDLTPYQQIGSSLATFDLSTFSALRTIAGSSGTPWNNAATFNSASPCWELTGDSSMQKTLNLLQAGTYTVAVRAKRLAYSNAGTEVLDITLGASTTNVVVTSTNELTYTGKLAADAGGRTLFIDDWSASGPGADITEITLTASPAVAGTAYTQAPGDWNSPDTWVGSSVPQDGDTVTVYHNVTLTNSTAKLAACTVSAGRTNTFGATNAVLNAQQVTVYGALTHANNTATSTNALGQWVPNARVFVICSNLLVDAAGSINADALGYAGALATTNGCGPGGGGPSGGGGYGGQGGDCSTGPGSGGPTNGSAALPDQPGSGGGNKSGGDPAGAGGGLIWIQATQGTVTVNGRISANGAYLPLPAASGNGRGAGGSGGGIFLACRTFAGSNGAVSAIGGAARHWFPGGGGGGRIAVAVDTNAQASAPPVAVQFQCGGGSGQDGGATGACGTIYVTDSRILPTVWTNTGGVLLGFSSWTPAQLAITNCLLSLASRAQINVTGNLSLAGSATLPAVLMLTNASSLACGGNLSICNATLVLGRGADTTAPSLMVGGNLSLINTGLVYVCAATTNPPSQTTGAWVTVAGMMSLTNSSVVYPYCHETNGGYVTFTVRDLTLADTNSGFDATGKGYWGAPASTSTNGFGPGAGKLPAGVGAIGGGGGGYGGGGGAGWSNPAGGGGTYGASNSPPICAGSGGGNRSDGIARAGDGGGVVWIEAGGTVTMNGYLKASGTLAGTGDRGGGGAGGGIYLRCRRLQGTAGSMTANGGPGRTWGGGGGGGGRIQVWSGADLTGGLLPASVLPGCAVAGESGSNGSTGTVYWGTVLTWRGTAVFGR